jgi:hypothetical protein
VAIDGDRPCAQRKNATLVKERSEGGPEQEYLQIAGGPVLVGLICEFAAFTHQESTETRDSQQDTARRDLPCRTRSTRIPQHRWDDGTVDDHVGRGGCCRA